MCAGRRVCGRARTGPRGRPTRLAVPSHGSDRRRALATGVRRAVGFLNNTCRKWHLLGKREWRRTRARSTEHNGGSEQDHEPGHDTAPERATTRLREPGQRPWHGSPPDADQRWLSIALALISAFLVGRGLVSGSVANSLACSPTPPTCSPTAACDRAGLVAMPCPRARPGAIFTTACGARDPLRADNGLTLLAALGLADLRGDQAPVDPARSPAACAITAVVGSCQRARRVGISKGNRPA